MGLHAIVSNFLNHYSRRALVTSKKKFTRVNDQIRVPQVRLIGADGSQVGLISTNEALKRAGDDGLDLVEVAPNAQPPVCRIMDFGKFKYEQSKKDKSNRKKQTVINVKEIRFRPKIETHDFDFKLKNARKFLEAGDKVKAIVFFRGREMAHREFGAALLDRLKDELADVAKIEREALMEGRSMVMYLVKK